jgi:hypothetical protein
MVQVVSLVVLVVRFAEAVINMEQSLLRIREPDLVE